VPVTGLEGLGNETGVDVCGGTLVANGSLGHFETAETDWHGVFLGNQARLTGSMIGGRRWLGPGWQRC
jgi:hypothetical protein